MSQQIIAISWSHHHTPLNYRDKLALSQKEIQQCIRFTLFEDQVLELAVLSTCNRIEFYALAESSAHVLTIIENLYSDIIKRNILWYQSAPEIYTGMDTVLHLCRVAAGMESMVLGESQILAQVKAAQQTLIRNQPDADALSKLFNDAIHSAETMRNDAPLFSGPTSISELVVKIAEQIFDNLDMRKILLVGAGETARLTAHCFKVSGFNKIIIANRSEKRGSALAESISGDYINMSHINDILFKCDVIVTATHSGNYLIKREQIENIMKEKNNSLLLLDISTPRNMDPCIRNIENVCFYDLDHLDTIASNNRKQNKEALAKAEMIIQHHGRKVMDWYNLRDLQRTRLELIEEEN